MNQGGGDRRQPTRPGRRWRAGCLGCLGLTAALLCLGAALRLVPAPPLAGVAPNSHLLRGAEGTILRLTLASDGQYRLWTPLAAMAPAVIEALLLKEDRYFYCHPGINPLALARAAWRTYGQGLRQGGSTLTMQLARRLYRLNTRQLAGKLKQIALALWLEGRYSKAALLEAYCNLAPMGGNIEGVAAAARIYFAKEAGALSVAEALALAVMPQDPSRRARFGAEQQQARRRLAPQWQQLHPDQGPQATLSDQVLVGLDRRHLPFLAPHLTDQLLKDAGPEAVIDTTLDPQKQRLIERLLGQYLNEHRHQGLTNAVVLLVDRRDLGVKALVGSANYFDAAIQGQVNGVRAKRSPGSTLKPLVYGLALDQGLIHPLSILDDAPTAFGPFQPENFDGRFIGPISARDALNRSRNVPAIGLAARLQPPTLHDLLRTAGIAGLRPESHYGLTLALGSGELTMAELAGLYAMLANDGLFKPLRYRQTDPVAAGIRLLSPQAAFLVREMLRANPRPDHLAGPDRLRPGAIAWKTGTSWGFRDAWSIGLAGDSILAVWIGNFNGRPNPALVGVKAAAPLLFRISDALALAGQTAAVDQPPPGLIQVEVCAASGDLPNRWCPQTASTWFIPGTSPIRVSTLHRPVLIDQHTGKAACPPYDPATTREEIFEFWPSHLQQLFRQAGLPRRLPPEPGAECSRQAGLAVANDPPRLASPLAKVTYTLRLSRPEETIALHASAAADSAVLYWFVGTRYLGSKPSNGVLDWRPDRAGLHDLTVVDDQGRSTSRTLAVEFVP